MNVKTIDEINEETNNRGIKGGSFLSNHPARMNNALWPCVTSIPNTTIDRILKRKLRSRSSGLLVNTDIATSVQYASHPENCAIQ